MLLCKIPSIYREILVGGKGITIIETIAGMKGIHNIETIAGGREHNIIKSYRCASSFKSSHIHCVALNLALAASNPHPTQLLISLIVTYSSCCIKLQLRRIQLLRWNKCQIFHHSLSSNFRKLAHFIQI